MSSEGYDVAQFCENGHLINSLSSSQPQFNKAFCSKCGAKSITQCLKCQADIKGYYHVPHLISPTDIPTLKFCDNCGEPYPWTKQSLDAAKDLTDGLDELTTGEKESLKKALDEIVHDTPKTPVAAAQFRKLMTKAGHAAAEGFKSILINVLSEVAKKQMGL